MGNWDKDFAVMLLMEEVALIHQEDVTPDELHGPWQAQKKNNNGLSASALSPEHLCETRRCDQLRETVSVHSLKTSSL